MMKNRNLFHIITTGIALIILLSLSTTVKAETFCSYTGPDLSEDLMRLTDFSVTGTSPLKEGNNITVKFKLQNYGQFDVNLGARGIFAASRDPDNLDTSFGFTYVNTTMKVGETRTIEVSRVLDKAGTWKIWPSYHLSLVTGEKLGPNEWHVCNLQVSAAVKDSDQDGIADEQDNCPTKYNPKQEDIDQDGMGDACDPCDDRDFDKDGIKNCLDKCPNEPETFNNYQDDDGCPDTPPAPSLPVKPSIAGITPNKGTVGQMLKMSISGSNFKKGASVIFNPTTGLTFGPLDIANNKIDFNLTLGQSAPLGLRTVTVINPDGERANLSDAFEVKGLEITTAPGTMRLPPAPNLRMTELEVDQDNSRYRFKIQNIGDAHYSGSVRIISRIKSMGIASPDNWETSYRTQTLPERTYLKSNYWISDWVNLRTSIADRARGDRFFLLPEKLFLADGIIAEVNLYWTNQFGGEERRDYTFEHRWQPKQKEVSLFVGLFDNVVHGTKFYLNRLAGDKKSYIDFCYLNDFYSPDRVCSKTIFDIPRFDFGGYWVADFRYFINDMTAEVIADELRMGMERGCGVYNGGITFEVPFETAGKEIIGYEETWGRFYSWPPDIDLRGNMKVKITLIPAAVSGKLSYSEARVDVSIGNANLTGVLGRIVEFFWNLFGDFKSFVEGKMEDAISSKLNEGEIKTQITQILTDRLAKSSIPSPVINRVTNTEVTPDDKMWIYGF